MKHLVFLCFALFWRFHGLRPFKLDSLDNNDGIETCSVGIVHDCIVAMKVRNILVFYLHIHHKCCLTQPAYRSSMFKFCTAFRISVVEWFFWYCIDFFAADPFVTIFFLDWDNLLWCFMSLSCAIQTVHQPHNHPLPVHSCILLKLNPPSVDLCVWYNWQLYICLHIGMIFIDI